MKKAVLCMGNCDPDHYRLAEMLQASFDVAVLRANSAAAARDIIAKRSVDLVLINREFFHDGDSGIAFIEALQQIDNAPPAMLISNFADAQKEAEQVGALPGFGKRTLNDDATRARLAKILASTADAAGEKA